MVLRMLVAVAALVSAAVHFKLWLQGFSTLEWIGPLFLLNAAGGLVIAVAVAAWRHWLPLLAAVGFGAATLAAFEVSVTVGMFGFNEVFWGRPQLIAGVAEAVTLVVPVWILVREYRRDSPSHRAAAPGSSTRGSPVQHHDLLPGNGHDGD